MNKWLWITATLMAILFLVIVFLNIPQVKYSKNKFGANLEIATGWNKDSIQKIKNYLDSAQHIDAFIALEADKVIFHYGQTNKLINLHSLRKPIISLLIGIARDKGLLRLDESLGSLDIQERNTTLSKIEKTATIRDLLMSRSGIYLQADAQPEMDNVPQRGQHEPGEHYYYNNFDFNVLGTILKIKTGMSYESCLYEWIARPLQMQDFQVDHVVYGTPFGVVKTNHPAYKTWMSARDLARIGAMIINGGMWNGNQIVTKEWLKESMTPRHLLDEEDRQWPKDAFGYLWYIDSESNNIWGTGYGGQMLMIDTTNNLSLVQRHDTGNSLLTQALYLSRSTQGSQVDLMQVWYALLRAQPFQEKINEQR